MAIDLIRGGRIPNRGIRTTKTSNAYLKTLIKVTHPLIQLYAFLSRRTDSKFNTTIHKRLNQSRLNRYPISISRISRILNKDKLFQAKPESKPVEGALEKVANTITGAITKFFKKPSNKDPKQVVTPFTGRIVAVVGTVTNDNRFLEVPQGLRICALKFTNAARARIVKANGECLTFDQLAQIAPTGKNVLLVRGPRDREAKRFFGLYPGQKGSHTAPRVRTEGRKWERARGRR